MILKFTDHLDRRCGEYSIADPEQRFRGLPLNVLMINGRVWQILCRLDYRVKAVPGLADKWVTLPAGTLTDFATIPRIAWMIIGPPTGNGEGAEYGLASVIHDHLCVRAHAGEFERWRADAVFLEIMEYCQVAWWRARLMWLAVRMAGIF